MDSLRGKSPEAFLEQVVAAGLLDQGRVQSIVDQVVVEQQPMIVYLIEHESINSKAIVKIASEFYGIPQVDLVKRDLSTVPKEYIELPVVRDGYALPLEKKGETLLFAVVDPTIPALQDLIFLTGCRVEYVLAEFSQLHQALDSVQAPLMEVDIESELTGDFEELDVSKYKGQDLESEEYAEYAVIDTPIVRYVNKIVLDAIRSKSSDIHFEPYETFYRVRYRQDGVLYEVSKPPLGLAGVFVARLKVMSDLDISERRVPQDGRFKMRLEKGRSIDFRVSTLPTVNGEKVVIRILDPETTALDVNTLGFNDVQKENYLKAIRGSQGIILVTGPTGSGKTVSLYSAMKILNTSDKNISTIEDPVEIYMSGINQVQVNIKAGLTFPKVLRSFLRQDPDIMMVGEIRDLETAEIAIKAAQTGHLVLSTLHTNNAPETLLRLSNMGVKAFNISSSIILVMAQRLVRRLCMHCKKAVEYPDEVLITEGFDPKDIGSLEIYGPGSCDKCVQGYRGRVGIYEVMPISDEMQQLIMSEANVLELVDQARKEGIDFLRDSGLAKVREGVTSLEEVDRVTTA